MLVSMNCVYVGFADGEIGGRGGGGNDKGGESKWGVRVKWNSIYTAGVVWVRLGCSLLLAQFGFVGLEFWAEPSPQGRNYARQRVETRINTWVVLKGEQ